MFLRGADHNPAAIWTRHSPLDEHHVLGLIELEDADISHGDLLAAVSATHAHALHHPRRIGTGADRSAVTMHALDAVAGALAIEIVPLHDPREAATLGETNQVNAGHIIQNSHIDNLADFELVLFAVGAKLTNKPLRFTVGLFDRLEPLAGPHLLPVAVD